MAKATPDIAHHFLFPSTLLAESKPHLVQTILGSCVAVCLYDTRIGIGGINHYMLPVWTGNGLPSPKYGDVAIDLLVEKMLSLGAQKRNMIAKVFGGASQNNLGHTLFEIGKRNIAIAEKNLYQHGISIEGKSTGGDRGRKILFNTASGQVLMTFLEKFDLKVSPI